MSFVFPKYILTCYDIVNEEDGTSTYKKVFERMKLPAKNEKIDFYVVFAIVHSLGKSEDRKLHIYLTDSNDEIMEGEEMDITMDPVKPKGHRVSIYKIRITGFSPKEPGFYTIYVDHEGERLTRHDIMVGKEG